MTLNGVQLPVQGQTQTEVVADEGITEDKKKCKRESEAKLYHYPSIRQEKTNVQTNEAVGITVDLLPATTHHHQVIEKLLNLN